MRKFLYIILFISLAFSCKKDNTLMYNNVTMGNIDGESIVSDQGNRFLEEGYDFSQFRSGRVMVTCDVLSQTAEGTYDVRISAIDSVLVKDIKTMEDATEEQTLEADDPVLLRNVWYSGGYLNMIIEMLWKDKDAKHYINLVHDVENSTEGNYILTLKHDASGEVPSEGNTDYKIGQGLVSFPLANFIEGDSAKLTLKWNSYKTDGYNVSLLETETRSKEYSWKRGGHEHTPRSAVINPSPLML